MSLGISSPIQHPEVHISNLVATPTIDINGRHTVVYRKSNSSLNSLIGERLKMLSAPSAALSPTDIRQAPNIIGEITALSEFDASFTEVYEDTVFDTATNTLQYEYSEAYDVLEDRVGFLSGNDGISGFSELQAVNDTERVYSFTVGRLDTDTGHIKEVRGRYSIALPDDTAPTVEGVVSKLTRESEIAERYNCNNANDVMAFAHEMNLDASGEGYELAQEKLMSMHYSANKLRELVGTSRFGDYVYGRSKAQHGYTSGIAYVTD